MTRFRVLGPLAVDRSPPLRAQMERRLLAALLCRPNVVVPLEDLIAALWGEQEPPSARKTLQVYVHRLRVALEEDSRIVHEGNGYRISIDAGELDSLEFARLVRHGRLAEALGLWRGAAFEDVREHSPIADEARLLDEERLRIDAIRTRQELDAGRHAELVPHLTRLMELHPYREDFRGHLMLALYRCGRQSEALEIYRGTRKLLDEQLGVEPGPDLQRLHEAILRADPSLDLPRRAAGTVPRELPPDIPGFVGREAHLRELDGMLPHTWPVIVSAIAGSAGVGKTSLAVHWAHKVVDRFPDGQLYLNLRGFDPAGPPTRPADAVRRLLDALGVAPQRIPATPDAQEALYRSLLADKRVLIVLDNARDAEQVRPLLPGGSASMVVLTSRNRMPSLVATNGARPLMIDVLSVAESRELLSARLGAHRVAHEPAAVDDIIARCARLPLALAVAAAHAAMDPSLSLAEVASSLRHSRAFVSDDPMTDVHAVFSWSYRQLSPAAARLFRLLGLHHGPDITAPAAASLAARQLSDVDALLRELTRAHLVAEPEPGRYTFHDLLRAYAAGLAQGSDLGAASRIADHYLHTAHTAAALLDPSRSPIPLPPSAPGVQPEAVAGHEQAMAWFAAEHRVLFAAIRETGRWELVWALAPYLDRQGHWRDWAEALHATLDTTDDSVVRADAHRTLGRVYGCLLRYDDAHTHYTQALEFYASLGDHAGQANTHMGLGWILQEQGRHPEALEHGRRALALLERAADRAGLANALNAVGWFHTLLGEHDRALDYCTRALALHQEVRNRMGQADTWDSIAHAHHHLGDLAEAAACYRTAIELYRAEGHRYYEAVTLEHLAETHLATGDGEAARAARHSALEILTELDHPDAERVRYTLD